MEAKSLICRVTVIPLRRMKSRAVLRVPAVSEGKNYWPTAAVLGTILLKPVAHLMSSWLIVLVPEGLHKAAYYDYLLSDRQVSLLCKWDG